ncbi:2-amino-4-hydroxy-6-hydroxymethyldihydropteridine diphosphokinase [Natronospira proteinivora]|uniref:2-amino-4-hydroxy-6-hydroxymethyldihydropteridine pyrophosphokinase n=1 Tax=Natronospira proteinivora TaxID=1807133 RepID=A0ABT1G4H4_9GAMM|nr:2-amino-4-hydroxy-6-hydroxymethyldihydropteridine diphosphokinase [Natronospira proteinivora]MCP1726197.1 2-amino-4-hydroxy-6-hydroxymethyldihydropteridine diphosphokinase [Natronospira proteinivora]
MNDSANAWIGLGANLGEPRTQLEAALAAIDALDDTRVVLKSSFYQTPPMGGAEQPDYLNAVAGIRTMLTPEALLEGLLSIETRLGRRRDGQLWGPRVIDLDLLCYGDQRRDTAFLRLPHPGMAKRAFVLKPLAEVAPDLDIPGQGRVASLCRAVDDDGIVKMEE